MLLKYYVFEIVIFNFQTLNTKIAHVQNWRVDGFLAIFSVRLQILKIGHVQEKQSVQDEIAACYLRPGENVDKKFWYYRR